jgi:putative two-component system response regulator
VDYITRPIRPGILLSRVRAHLSDAASSRAVRVSNEYLEYEVAKRSRQLTAMQDVTILAMASLAEKRDTDTGNHLRRTQNYVRLLATHMQSKPVYADFLSDTVIDTLYRCAPLHDIGKVGIPDAILLKPGKLTAQEFEVMKTHANIGAQAIGDAIHSVQQARVQSGNPEDAAQTALALNFLETTRQIAGSHHEKWNGSGYPEGLAGDAIPVAARLMALADVFDALLSRRHYKDALPLEETVAIIQEGRGSHFDPDIVDAFLEITDQFAAIARRFADTPSP